MFKAAIFLSVILTIILKGYSLDCYVCDDCEQVKDEYVASCEDLASNSTSTTTTSSTTSTTPTSTSTESSTISTTTPTTTSTTESTSTDPSTNTTTSATTTTETTSSSTTTTTSTTTEGSYFMDRDASANNTYECVQGKITVNNTQVTVRGCMINRGNNSCTLFGMAPCSVCSTDKCNGAGSTQSSVVILLLVSLSTYLFKK